MILEASDRMRVLEKAAIAVLGSPAPGEGNSAEAVPTYEKSFARLRVLEARHDLAVMLRNLGRAALSLGETRRARILFRESLSIHQAEQDRASMVECLTGLGAAAIVEGLPAAGVRLLAAALSLRGQESAQAWPIRSMEVGLYLDLARARLKAAEFHAEQSAGRALSLEEAVQYAQDLPLKPGATAGRIREMGRLTRREREVAALIERGLSNRAIADELVLSTRTVEKHVANILSKLGMTRRAQVVRWALENGLRIEI